MYFGMTDLNDLVRRVVSHPDRLPERWTSARGARGRWMGMVGMVGITFRHMWATLKSGGIVAYTLRGVCRYEGRYKQKNDF